MKRTFVAFVLVATSIWANDCPDQTFQMKNGRFWSHLESDEYKFVYLRGIFDGWDLRGMTKDSISGEEIGAWIGGPKSTISDLSASVTSIYQEPENLVLPIGWVVMGVFAVQRGDTTRDVVFMALRKQLAEVTAAQGSRPMPLSEISPIHVIMKLSKKP